MVLYTPNNNLPYVQATDTVTSYPVTSQDLATKLDAITTDSGWVTTGFVAATGFTVHADTRYRLINNFIVSLYIRLTRTGANVVADATGGLVDVSLVTVPAAIKPAVYVHPLVRTSASSGSGVMDTTGLLKLADMHSTSTLATNDFVYVSDMYLLG